MTESPPITGSPATWPVVRWTPRSPLTPLARRLHRRDSVNHLHLHRRPALSPHRPAITEASEALNLRISPGSTAPGPPAPSRSRTIHSDPWARSPIMPYAPPSCLPPPPRPLDPSRASSCSTPPAARASAPSSSPRRRPCHRTPVPAGALPSASGHATTMRTAMHASWPRPRMVTGLGDPRTKHRCRRSSYAHAISV